MSIPTGSKYANFSDNVYLGASLYIDPAATGGGYNALISGSTDRFYIAPSDMAGSYQFGKELSFDPAGDATWTAEGGFKTTGALDATGDITSGGTVGLDKTTADEPFINFQATADADATSAISTLTTSGTTTHHIQVDINGTKAWIAVSTNAPS
jgi:hypothetical protein